MKFIDINMADDDKKKLSEIDDPTIINIDNINIFDNNLTTTAQFIRVIRGTSISISNIMPGGLSGSFNVQFGSSSSKCTAYIKGEQKSVIGFINSGSNNRMDILASKANGSWTPIIYGTSTAGNNTYSVQLGNIARAGNIVLVTFRIKLSGSLDSTGDIRISGLPYECSYISGSAGYDNASPMGTFSSVTLDSGDILCSGVVCGTKVLKLLKISSSGETDIADGDIGDDMEIRGTITYFTNDYNN